MAHRIFAGILIVLSSLLLVLSAAGIGAAWIYNERLTREAVARLEAVDGELVQAQTGIRNARAEMERTLRIVESAEKALASLKSQTEEAKKLFEAFNGTLENTVIPGLQTTRGTIGQLRDTLQKLRDSLEKLNSIPFVGIDLPGDATLAGLIKTVDALNSQISDMQDLAKRAGTFMSDTAFVLGGDMTETKQRMQVLLDALVEYDRKVTGWHTEVSRLIESTPGWIDQASGILTIFLLWFGFSQFGLLLHGLRLWKGNDPLSTLRRKPASETVME
jgi:predicted  nucleic acid-binding Zn-ribbon protein